MAAVSERHLKALTAEAAAVDEALERFSPAVANDHRDGRVRRMLAAADASAVVLALALVMVLSDRDESADHLVWALIALPVMIVLFKVYGLYDRDVKRISHSTVDDVPWLLHATAFGTLVLWLYAKVTPLGRLDLFEVVLFGSLTLGFVLVFRYTMRFTMTRLDDPHAAVLVGGGRMGSLLSAKLAAHPEYRCRVVGILSDSSPTAVGLPVLGGLQQLETVAVQRHIERVIVSPGEVDERELEELLRRCRKLSMKVSLLPTLSDLLGPAVEIDDVAGVTVLGVNPPWLPRSSRALKRATDITVALALLLLLAPLLLILALVIKLDSRGPILFAQERVGRGGQRFRLLKFRTMVADAEARRHQLVSRSSDPNWLKLDHDPRITRSGRLMRRLSLDELPQFWNVLRGQMSLVGPRPLIPCEDERVQAWARGRLDLTPGITGYWQVLGRTMIPFEEMVKLDYLYVMNWSLWEDVRLLLKTLPVVIGGRGAN